MINKRIIEITPLNKSIGFIIHINNLCNFKCSYCTAGQQISPEKLEFEDFEKIILALNNIRNRGDSRKINIDITGGEPTLNNDLIKIITLFLEIDNIELKVTTNLFRLSYFYNDLQTISKHKNINSLFFNISYHYFEYGEKNDTFIESILFLLNNNFNFSIKFLLPDSNIILDDFLKIFNKIVRESKITKKHFFYDLITKNGEVSSTYSKSMLDFFHKETMNYSVENNNLKVYFDDGTMKDLNMFYIRSNGLNGFKGFDCFYVSNDYVEINISHTGYVTFGPCYVLDSMRYSIDQISEILSQERKITCSEKMCDCGIQIKKIENSNYSKIKGLENILVLNLNKIIIDVIIYDIQLSLQKSIIIIFKLDNYYINLIIERINLTEKYYFTKNEIGYNLRIKNHNNIVFNMKELDKRYILLLNKNISIISILETLFKKII